MRTTLLGAAILLGAAAPALANPPPVHFRSVDGCYDQIQSQFTVTSDLISAKTYVVEIPEPLLHNRPTALVHVQAEYGVVTWPAGYLFPNVNSFELTPHPFYATDRGKWFLWDQHGWQAGEIIDLQATYWNGTCQAIISGPVITR